MPDTPTLDAHATAHTLAAALPYMQRYTNETVVVKYGGHAMGDDAISRDFARDVALLKQAGVNPVVVHGGGPQIKAMLARLGIESRFEAGLRVTDAATVEIVEMVLAGLINKGLVSAINGVGGRAVGLSGKDANMVRARKLTRTLTDPDSHVEQVLDLGFVGEPDRVSKTVIEDILARDLTPVIAPIAYGAEGETYNVNADTFAGAVSGALRAKRLLLLTDVAGVLDKSGALIPELRADEARALIADGTISGGMIPKIETCLEAVARGVEAVVIVDGRVPHAILLELFTDHGAGTRIRAAA